MSLTRKSSFLLEELSRQLRKVHLIVSDHTGILLSGDSFKQLADHVLDTHQQFRASRLKKGDLLFVQSQYLKYFFEQIHPDIQHPYILLSHNSDLNITSEFKKYLDDKITHWFAQNLLFTHPRTSLLPIGLENYSLHYRQPLSYFPAQSEFTHTQKIPQIFLSVTPGNNPSEREACISALRSLPTVTFSSVKLPQRQYLTAIKRHMFVACPAGNGVDTHRIWEALYMGAVPIIKDSIFAQHLKKLAFPLLIVKEWNELKKINSKQLELQYTQLSLGKYQHRLRLAHWQQLITQYEKQH